MASKIKVDELETVSGSGVITVNQPLSGSGASLTSLPAANLTGTLPAIDGSNLTGVSGGKVLQVVSVAKADAFSSDSSSYVDITGLTVNITPSATSSKVYAVANFSTRHNDAGMNPSFKLLRDSTSLGVVSDFYHPSGSGVSGNITIVSLDSPSSTSALTYKVQVEPSKDSTTTLHINRDYDNNLNGIATIVLMEIGA